ncbi:MAG TPA: dUTP diphosphatase [Thermosynergistes sp.]|nr:dUTP diphosphatase [Thermosynergistes sp.]
MGTGEGTIIVKIARKREALSCKLPSYATFGASGVDLRAAEEVTINPGEWVSVGTGLYIELPPGYEGQVRPRSGLALRWGGTVLNAPGTVDSDYRGEVRVILINHGKDPFHIEVGDRIAQLVIAPVARGELQVADELSSTERGKGGFGSTGL